MSTFAKMEEIVRLSERLNDAEAVRLLDAVIRSARRSELPVELLQAAISAAGTMHHRAEEIKRLLG
jgi:hypothetical protein